MKDFCPKDGGNYTNSKNFIDPVTKKIITREVCHPKENILNYSINLAGVYKKEDILLDIPKNHSKRNVFYLRWNECEKGITPSKYVKIDDRGCFYLKLDEVYNITLPDSQNSLSIDFEIYCTVHHNPAKINFWHFELNWESLNNEELIKQQSKRWRKNKLSTTARTFIKEIGIAEMPKYIFQIPKKEYKKNLLQIINCFFKNPKLIFRFNAKSKFHRFRPY